VTAARAGTPEALRWAAVPPLLKQTPRWILWQAGEPKPDGKFAKVPVSATTGRNCNANDPDNWLTFENAVAACRAGRGSGIGIVLCDQPVANDDRGPLYLVAVDLDRCSTDPGPAKQLRKELGNTYVEVSPSGIGLRMFALSRHPVKGGNAGNGRELYGSGRFMTVTGVCGRGKLVDATEELARVHNQWFPPKTATVFGVGARAGESATPLGALTLALAYPPPPESPEHVARVKDQLSCVSADCSYEVWRNIVWSVLSSRWTVAEDIARTWSMTASDRYDERAFAQTVKSFDASRGITLGSLDHHARLAGWTPDRETASEANRYTLSTPSDLKTRPLQTWRVKRVLPAIGVAAIYGPSASGKSFLALDLAAAIATGSHWFANKTEMAPVVYVMLEGEGAIRNRIAALEAAKGPLPDKRFGVVTQPFQLTIPQDVTDLIAVIPDGATIFIDTLNRAAPSSDENSSKEMGQILQAAKQLQAATGGLVVVVHHTGKDSTKGPRGHSSLFAALDAAIEVERTANGSRHWSITKNKDGEDGKKVAFKLRMHVLGRDADGEDITSCSVEIDQSAVFAKAEPQGKNQKAALKTVRELLTGPQAITGKEDLPAGTACMKVEDAIEAVASTLTTTPGNKRRSEARRLIRALTADGFIGSKVDGGAVAWCWLE
jgi:hypothetical protein